MLELPRSFRLRRLLLPKELPVRRLDVRNSFVVRGNTRPSKVVTSPGSSVRLVPVPIGRGSVSPWTLKIAKLSLRPL